MMGFYKQNELVLNCLLVCHKKNILIRSMYASRIKAVFRRFLSILKCMNDNDKFTNYPYEYYFCSH